MQLDSMLDDERFSTRTERVRNIVELLPPIELTFQTKTTCDWYDLPVEANITCAPIYTVDQCFADPQVKHRGPRKSMTHPLGEIETIANPINFSHTPISRYDEAPVHGAASAELLAELLGLSSDDGAALRSAAII